MVAIKKKGLGRGLEALLGEKTPAATTSTDINRLPLTALQAGSGFIPYDPVSKTELHTGNPGKKTDITTL